MTSRPLTDPLSYIETTIPAGMTVTEYRCARPRPAGRLRRLRRALGRTS